MGLGLETKNQDGHLLFPQIPGHIFFEPSAAGKIPPCHAGTARMTHWIRVWITRISLSKAFSWRSLPQSPVCIIILQQHWFCQLSLFFLISTIYNGLFYPECISKHKDNEAFSQSQGKHKASCEQYPSRFFFDAPSILKGIQEHFHTSRSTAVK